MGGTIDTTRGIAPSSAVISRNFFVPFSAWFASHFIGFLGLVIWPTRSGEWFNTFGLTHMDGGWYRIIVTSGFPNGPLPDHATAWPFFPLYPWIADLFIRVGAPVGPALISVSWIFALVAMIGVWQLTFEMFGRDVAVMSIWTFALLPGAVGQVLAYSDSLFAAGLVWTLFLLHRLPNSSTESNSPSIGAFALVGLCASVVVASRPNGALFLIAVVHAIWQNSRWRRALPLALLPSVVFFGCWMIYCHNKTGDTFVFLSAKSAWLERTIIDFITYPTERPANLLHVAVLVIVVTLAWKRWSDIPRHWITASVVLIGPSMILGIEGLARYVTITVPASIMVALTLARHERHRQVLFLGIAGSAMLFLAVNVVRSSWVP